MSLLHNVNVACTVLLSSFMASAVSNLKGPRLVACTATECIVCCMPVDNTCTFCIPVATMLSWMLLYWGAEVVAVNWSCSMTAAELHNSKLFCAAVTAVSCFAITLTIVLTMRHDMCISVDYISCYTLKLEQSQQEQVTRKLLSCVAAYAATCILYCTAFTATSCCTAKMPRPDVLRSLPCHILSDKRGYEALDFCTQSTVVRAGCKAPTVFLGCMLSIYVVKPCVPLLAGLCLHFADAWLVEQPGPSTWFVWQQISDHACMHGRPYGRPYGRVMNSAQCG
jgi:hypothetical protein